MAYKLNMKTVGYFLLLGAIFSFAGSYISGFITGLGIIPEFGFGTVTLAGTIGNGLAIFAALWIADMTGLFK